ncbi:hypothetical protein Taro_028540 [Colocasia esculenta]|uniref:Uncharacterized protein n=1 Tax=Colocasia esculenta TaxID=4460 RepID=A0A843VIV5_COLES|nr:hypothetical protein [Colocasia esculenta]
MAQCTDGGKKMCWRNRPMRDLLSQGVLHPVSEQQLGISLNKSTVPLKDSYTSSNSWPSLLYLKSYNQHLMQQARSERQRFAVVDSLRSYISSQKNKQMAVESLRAKD